VVAGDAATIVLDTNGGALRIVTFAPHPGWFTVRLEQPSATDLSAVLEAGGSVVRFTARLADGALSTELVIGGAAVSVPVTPPDSAPGTGPDGSSSSSSSSSPDNTGSDGGGGNSGPGGGGDDHGGGGSGSG
jgi:hypothetical protein